MRKRPLNNVCSMVACAMIAGVAVADAQQVERYAQGLQFGTGYINTPVAWVSPRNSDSWLTLSGKDLPSFGDGSENSLASRVNTNFAIDTHWGGRVSIGVSLYSQNPEWGFFAQGLLIRDGDFSIPFLPALAIGIRNLGPNKHEDRFLIGHDVALNSSGAYDDIVVPRYQGFDTSPTLYAVATKDIPLSDYSAGGRTSMSLSLGWGNGLFHDDGGLGDQYNSSGTIARGLFLGSRFITHPSENTSLTLLAENDGWDWNAGVVGEWRGLTVGFYGTELEAGGREGDAEGFNVYNYAKFNFAFGYSGNLGDISRGVVLRARVGELTREQNRLRSEIAARERRIRTLEGQLAEAQQGELAQLERRRQQLEIEVQAEREAIKRASDRLRELEQGGGKPAVPKPTPPPPTRPPTEP